jgi:high-affinity iron transporter
MFGPAVIVFRETLEAALLVGIVAASTRGLLARNRHLALGLGLGLLGALLVAGFTEQISRVANGIGQEIFNAVVLGAAVLMLAWHNMWMSRHGAEMAAQARQVANAVMEGRRSLSAIVVVVALAVLREGSETALFLYGMAAGSPMSAATVLLGGLLGLGAGAALGAFVYAGLVRVPVRWFFTVTSALILLLAAGMASQMARFLVQGDLLPALASPLWDSSTLLPAGSALGAFLRVLAGYEPRPSGMEVLFYLTALSVILAGMYAVRPAPRLRHS